MMKNKTDLYSNPPGYDNSMPMTELLKQQKIDLSCVSYRKITGASLVNNFWTPNFYAFIIFEKCNGIHSIDFVQHQLSDQDLLTSFPEQVHSWDLGEDTIAHHLLISKELMHSLYIQKSLINTYTNHIPVLALDHYSYEKLVKQFTSIHEEIQTSKPSWDEIRIRVKLVVIIISNLIWEKCLENRADQNPMVTAYLDLIDTHFKEKRSITEYAELLSIGPNYLNILCKKHLGISSKDCLHQKLTLEIKRFLSGTELTIKEIAFQLGFSEVQSLSSYFKKKTGMSPIEFRNIDRI